MKWAYGITTCSQRRDDLLSRTIKSLKLTGFDSPRLFVDNAEDSRSWHLEFGLDISLRTPTIRTFGNWILGLWELYIREPHADLYAMFQDDIVAVLGLREYLSEKRYRCPDKGYMNLYTSCFKPTMNNEPIVKDKPYGWYPAATLWRRDTSNTNPEQPPIEFLQCGIGACGLVFTRDGVVTLLSSLHIVERPQDSTYGHRKIDGGIVSAMNKAGYTEYIHNPSLIQHVGEVSSMRNPPHHQAKTFPGEMFDVRSLR